MNENEDFSGRLQFLGLMIVLIIAVLIGRAGYLQVYDGELYARLAEGNRIRIIPAEAARGTFYDRNGELLVTNRPGFAVSLLPLTEPISPEVIARVSKLINVPVEEIQKKIDAHIGFDPIRIKTDVLPDIVTIIEEQKDDYPGVVIEVLPIRDYIYGEYAAHVFGYVSEINEEELERRKDEGYKSGYIIGKFGLERVYDKEVRGVNGGDQVEVDVSGRPVQLLGRQSPVPGNDLVLTIDKHLQEAAEQAVDAQLALVHANAAAAVVMNPQTGEVLAMVSRPAFNPNLFAGGISTVNWNALNNNPYHPMDNKAITGEYPPGSTFKIVTGTAALAEHKVTPQEKIFDSGRHWIIPKTNAGGEARLDDELFSAAPQVTEMPSRTGAHWISFLGFLLLTPVAWFLAADAGARMTLADSAPMYTGIASFQALGELAGAVLVCVILFALARRSSLGAWIMGVLTLAAGLPWVLAPGVTASSLLGALTSLSQTGPVGANLMHHLQASGYSGRFVVLGALLMGVAYVSHSARRAGRAEEALRTSLETTNPAEAFYSKRARKRAAKDTGRK